jgi:uncharacterized membrane protein YhdT
VDPLIRLGPGAGALVFAAIVVWCHVKRPDVVPATQGVSHYAVGSTDAVMAIGFLSLAGALVVAALHLFPNAFLTFAAIGLFLVAATPMPDPRAQPWRGPAHTIGALAFFAFSAVGAVLASIGEAWWVLSIAVALVVAVVVFLASMSVATRLAGMCGWFQRACFALLVLWLFAVSLLPVSAALYNLFARLKWLN